MNIFVLDNNPRIAARYHADKHINKMLLESAQMFCAAVNTAANAQITPYRTTHLHHPCTRWVLASRQNAHWLLLLAAELNQEYKKRYNKPPEVQHKAWLVLYEHQNFLDLLPDTDTTTPFAQAMPEEFKDNTNPVRAYRAYYRTKTFAAWQRGTPAPDWW